MAKLLEIVPRRSSKLAAGLATTDELKRKLQMDLEQFEKIVDQLLKELRTLKADARRLGRRFR